MKIQAMAMRVINVPMRRILALPFSTPLSKRLMLVYITGRHSGRSYRQPVSYVPYEESLLTPGGGNWKLNLQQGRSERIHLNGHDVSARPDLVAEIDEIDSLLMIMTASNPRVASFIPIPLRDDGHFDRDGLANAIAHGFRIIRWDVESPPK